MAKTRKRGKRNKKNKNRENNNVQAPDQPSKRTKSTPNNDNDDADKNTSNEQSFFTPQLLNNKFSTPLPKISPIHNSTPKTSQRKKSVIIHQEDEEQQFCRRRSSSNTSSPRNLSVIQALSPILKNSVNDQKLDIKTLKQVGFLTPTKKVIGKFRKLGFRPPFSLVDLYNWLGLAMKKGFTTIKRMCYRTISDQSTSIKDSCKCSDYKNQITQLNAKIDELTAELQNVKQELRAIDDLKNEFKEFKQQILSIRLNPISSVPCVAPPPTPPPPPPPPPMISITGPTPTSRPTKTAVRKLDKQTADNSRPLITVDDILKVRLRKTTAAIPVLRKPPNRPANEVFKQVKLRPPSRPNTPQMLGSSPKSSLARILKNVDTNVRTVRRIKKAQFLSYDDISRHRSFSRQQATTGNDSAPVMS